MSAEIADWVEGLRSLDPQRTEVPGLLSKTWPQVHAYAIEFLLARGAEALAAGWTGLQLIGVHRAAGAMRADCTGILIQYRPVTVVSIAPKLIEFSNGLRDRGHFHPAESVPIWTFRASSRSARQE